jgi:hypothetical protein
MIDIDSYGGQVGRIRWQNTWNGLWGHTGFWDKNTGEKGRFTLWGIRPKAPLLGDLK